MLRYDHIMKRHPGNPLFMPKDFPYGKVDQIFNPGQCIAPDGRIILLISVVFNKQFPAAATYYAESTDGINFSIREEPLFAPGKDKLFAAVDMHPIDCRVTYFPEDECYYIIRPGSDALAMMYRTKDFITMEPMHIVALPMNRVPCLFPEKINGLYTRLDRPYNGGDLPMEKSKGDIWMAQSPDLKYWGDFQTVIKRGFSRWNSLKIGPTPPIKTEKGWLEIIHGVQYCYSSWRYSIGAILLDLEDPAKVIGKTNTPLLTPEEEYEHNGVIPDVVFTTGGIADLEKRTLSMYYGAADTCIGLATGDLDEVIDACLNEI